MSFHKRFGGGNFFFICTCTCRHAFSQICNTVCSLCVTSSSTVDIFIWKAKPRLHNLISIDDEMRSNKSHFVQNTTINRTERYKSVGIRGTYFRILFNIYLFKIFLYVLDVDKPATEDEKNDNKSIFSTKESGGSYIFCTNFSMVGSY